jgi:hypothetical protein
VLVVIKLGNVLIPVFVPAVAKMELMIALMRLRSAVMANTNVNANA